VGADEGGGTDDGSRFVGRKVPHVEASESGERHPSQKSPMPSTRRQQVYRV